MSDLSGIRALVFDVFGTVVDWREGVVREARRLVPDADPYRLADQWRAGYQPAMEAVRSGGRGFVRLDVLHREILVKVLGELGVKASGATVDELNLAWHRLDPWPEVISAFDHLRPKFILASLSNGNISLMVDMCRRSGLRFDAILGAEVARAYKPDPVVYRNAAEVLGLKPEQVLMVAAHPSDLDAAKACGLKTAYVHRPFEYGREREVRRPDAARFDLSVDSFTALAERLGA